MRTFHAPGRVNLIGEHTDYSGGLALPAAIDRGVTIRGQRRDGRIALRGDAEHEDVEVELAALRAPEEGWGRFVAAVAEELRRADLAPAGLEGELTSDLPIGAGLSSSAALEVVLAIALCAVSGQRLDGFDLVALGQRAEHRAVGVPTGIMDQAASVFGRAGHAVLLDCGARTARHVPLPQDLALLVVHSGVDRTLEGSGYADRQKELVEGQRVLDGRNPRDVTLEEARHAARQADLADVPWRRLRHVVAENERVRQTERALTRPGGADVAALGRLFAESHASLRDDYEVSTPELDRLVELAREEGAVAARMTGGGFGGAIVALVPRDRAQQVADGVAGRYKTPAGEAPLALVCEAADGAGER